MHAHTLSEMERQIIEAFPQVDKVQNDARHIARVHKANAVHPHKFKGQSSNTNIAKAENLSRTVINYGHSDTK